MIEEQYLNSEKVNEVRQRNRSLRRQFLKYKDAEIVYSLTHRKLLEMADEAGAIYRVDGTILINRDIFDEYLEQFHQKPALIPLIPRENRSHRTERSRNDGKYLDVFASAGC